MSYWQTYKRDATICSFYEMVVSSGTAKRLTRQGARNWEHVFAIQSGEMSMKGEMCLRGVWREPLIDIYRRYQMKKAMACEVVL